MSTATAKAERTAYTAVPNQHFSSHSGPRLPLNEKNYQGGEMKFQSCKMVKHTVIPRTGGHIYNTERHRWLEDEHFRALVDQNLGT